MEIMTFILPVNIVTRGMYFERRYKGYIIKDASYFWQTSRYILRNPVKAGITLHPEEYPWSSYRATMVKSFAILIRILKNSESIK